MNAEEGQMKYVLERYLVFTSELCEASHLELVANVPALGTKWSRRPASERRRQRPIGGSVLGMPVAFAPDSLRMGSIVIDCGFVQCFLQAMAAVCQQHGSAIDLGHTCERSLPALPD
jgi:hypothetical protein